MLHRRLLLGIALAALGCAGPGAMPSSAASRVVPSETPAVGPRGQAPASASSGATSNGVAPPSSPRPSVLCSSGTPPDAFADAKFEKLHAGPVLSIATGTPTRAAIWSGTNVTLFEGTSARELPAPRLPENASVEVFFGRDDQPRLMGFAPADPGREIPVYLRFRQGTFRPEPSELGPLGARRGALYGVLGFDDPEVVCRPREQCLVKRHTGWTRAAAHDTPARIVLRAGTIFALHATRIERLDETNGWSELQPTRAFDRPLDVWLAPGGELWVTDHSARGLFRLRDADWQEVESPVSAPRAVFGRSERAIYIVGSNGAAELDGTRFRCLRGVPGPLHLALAVGDAIWLGGESGVYRSVP